MSELRNPLFLRMQEGGSEHKVGRAKKQPRTIRQRTTTQGHARGATAQFATLVRSVTNSSAADGWIPMVMSNCALVAPQFSAIASP